MIVSVLPPRALGAVIAHHRDATIARHHDFVGPLAGRQRGERSSRRDVDDRGGRGRLVRHDQCAGQPGDLRATALRDGNRSERCHGGGGGAGGEEAGETHYSEG